MKPKILLSANSFRQYYVDALEHCGGEADVQYCPEVSLDYDGLLLCGGNDIDPKYYGEEINGAVNMDAQRDIAEMKLAKAYIEAGKPVMGICRGMQLLNVVFGGSLYQDLPNKAYHVNGTDHYQVHPVNAVEGSICQTLHGDVFPVNSAHHQAVKRLGRDLIPMAFSGDIVEAYRHKTLPIMGFQWHPERMCCSQAREDAVDGTKIFTYFLELCGK